MQELVESSIGADPDPSDPYRGLYISDDHAGTLAAQGVGELPDDRLVVMGERLGLDELDTAIVGLIGAPEVVPGYGRLYAYLHDDVTRKLASVGLLCRLLANREDPQVVRSRLASDAPLRRMGVVRVFDETGEVPVQDRPLRTSDEVAGFLVGASLGTATGLREPLLDAIDVAPHSHGDRVAAIVDHLEMGHLPLVVHGPDAEALLAQTTSGAMLVIDALALRDRERRQDVELAALLRQRIVCIDGLADVTPDDRAAVVAALDELSVRHVILSAAPPAALVLSRRPRIAVAVPPPSPEERAEAWSWYSSVAEVGMVADTYRLSVGEIRQACEVALAAADAMGAPVGPEHLEEGARHMCVGSLSELATRLTPAYRWEQLILPERPMAMLRSIFGFLRHRDQVLSDWGYERALAQNQGIKVLFAGDSGTGKSMAAQVLARELGLEIYRVDLATTVSKYIGETEKNLDRIFAAAEGSNAILFFDEADALFGKRSDVGDAHDRYANLETAYLLQRMESYPGAVVLATNYRNNIDEAFLRRLDVVIDFPFPAEADRKRIWQVALPGAAPIAHDLDLDFLAKRFSLSGGGIRNASLAAAFLAADAGGVIGMDHLVQGVANEYAKLGRLTMETDFERYHGLVTGTSVATNPDDANDWALSSRPGGIGA